MVYVDAELCMSCGLCMSNCPGGVFEYSSEVNKKGYNYVQPLHEDACIRCRLCEISCPDFAIYVE